MVLLFGAGTVVYYYSGYKDNFWVDAAAYLPVIFGWLCLLFLLIEGHIRVRETLKNRTGTRSLVNALFFILYPLWLVALVAGFLGLEFLSNERVERILRSPEARLTTGTVIRVETRRIKSTSHRYAVIRYEASGRPQEQALKDDSRLYLEGQQVRVRYADAHPDMFRVTSQQ